MVVVPQYVFCEPSQPWIAWQPTDTCNPDLHSSVVLSKVFACSEKPPFYILIHHTEGTVLHERPCSSQGWMRKKLINVFCSLCLKLY